MIASFQYQPAVLLRVRQTAAAAFSGQLLAIVISHHQTPNALASVQPRRLPRLVGQAETKPVASSVLSQSALSFQLTTPLILYLLDLSVVRAEFTAQKFSLELMTEQLVGRTPVQLTEEELC